VARGKKQTKNNNWRDGDSGKKTLLDFYRQKFNLIRRYADLQVYNSWLSRFALSSSAA